MSKKVFITGLGVISSIGFNTEENFENLCQGKSGIGQMSILESHYRDKLPVAEIKKTNTELKELNKLPLEITFTRGDLLAYSAVKEAVDDAGLTKEDLLETGFISSTTVGGMDLSESYYEESLTGTPSLKEIQRHDCGEISDFIAKEFGMTGFVSTISTACSSATNAIMLGSRLIKSGRAKRVIVGGVDPLCRFTINGFNSLYILSDERCKPFSDDRKGLNLGEAAAYVVLEGEDVVGDKLCLAEVVGYANSNDAHHQTASSPDGDGAYMAIKETLEMALVSADDVDYINVHGTATQNNDSSEGEAIKRVFGDNIPPFSSTKGHTGHTLAAAGAIEAVYSVLALNRNVIFPNLNHQVEMVSLGKSPETKLLLNQELNFVLSNSFGFGGNCSSVLFKKVN